MGNESRAPRQLIIAERLEADVLGHVQGVGFRYFVKMAARRLGLSGWVRNEADGSVRLVAEGPVRDLAELERRVMTGPDGADVAEVRATSSPATGEFSSFEVRR